MNARYWFSVQDIAPREAAMLLCRLNPLEPEGQDPERILVDGDAKSPSRYRFLLESFEREAKATRHQRTLLAWRDLAEKKGATCHPWIEEYMTAREALGEPLAMDSNAEIDLSDRSVGLSPAERRAALDMGTERGCRRRILESWNDIEMEYGPSPDGRQVLRVLSKDKDEKKPILKTVQNHLASLKKEGLIP